MSLRSRRNRTTRTVHALPPRQWVAASALELVGEVNGRLLEMLTRLAGPERPRSAPQIVGTHRELWRRLDAAARERAAQFPILLADIRFQDEDWWRRAKSPQSGHGHGATSRIYFPAKPAGELTRETLMLAWHVARLDRRAATLLLGMSPAVAAMIAALGLQELGQIAARHSRQLRPRWEDVPAFWRSLLVAARSDDRESLYELHLHGFQLLGSELLPHCG